MLPPLSPSRSLASSSYTYIPPFTLDSGYYPHLLALYQSVFIPIQSKAFTYSFSHLLPTSTATYFTFEGSSGAARPSLPSTVPLLTALSRLLVFAVSYAYLLLLAFSYRLTGWPGGTVSEWTANVSRRVWGGWVGSHWEEFVQEIIIVLFGAVGTCTDQDTGDLHIGLVLGASTLCCLTSIPFPSLTRFPCPLLAHRLHLPHPLHLPLHGPDLKLIRLASALRLPPPIAHPPLVHHPLPPPRCGVLNNIHHLLTRRVGYSHDTRRVRRGHSSHAGKPGRSSTLDTGRGRPVRHR